MSGPGITKAEVLQASKGMVIIRAGSLAEAKEIAGRDPMHKSGARTCTVRPWLLNEGGLGARIEISDSKHDMNRGPAAEAGKR